MAYAALVFDRIPTVILGRPTLSGCHIAHQYQGRGLKTTICADWIESHGKLSTDITTQIFLDIQEDCPGLSSSDDSKNQGIAGA